MKKGTSHDFLYGETNVERLSDRIKCQKLRLFYKIQHDLAPSSMSNIVPQTSRKRTQYPLRSRDNISLYETSTESLNQSFFPSVIRQWNTLPREIRESQTIERFCEGITPEEKIVPK